MKSDKIVDLLLDGKLHKIKDAENLVDQILVDGQEVETVTDTDVGDTDGKLASVPEEKKKREEESAKEQTDLEPAKAPEKVENELDSGDVDQNIGVLKKEVEADVAKEGALTEADIGPADFKDYFDDLKKKGMTDEKKLSGMLNRAKEIAKSQGKENDKNTIVGIMQGFVGGK